MLDRAELLRSSIVIDLIIVQMVVFFIPDTEDAQLVTVSYTPRV